MPESFSDSLRDLLQPMFYDDINQSSALSIYLGSLGDPLFQLVEDWASDTDNGEPGYSLLVDANRVPFNNIPWLAQFVGAVIWTTLPEDQARAQLKGLGTWKRGTVAALEAAAAPLLTGSQTVSVKERDTSPYHFQVYTLASETADQNKVLAALLSQKPAGLVMNYFMYAGQKAVTLKSSALRGSPADVLRLAI
jgi:hypothetical protein